jgi:hypothetical protein
MKSLIWRESISSGEYGDTLTQTKKRNLMATINTIPLNKYWADDAFPFELLPRFKELQLGGIYLDGSEAQKEPKASSFAPHSRDISSRRARVGLCPGHRRALL